MKKATLFTLSFLSLISSYKAQPLAKKNLDINNLNVAFLSDGGIAWDGTNGTFEYPKGSGKHTILAGNLWIGGYDTQNWSNLLVAAQTYKQTGSDFFPGPIDPTNTYGTTYFNNWNKVWKVNQCDIDTFNYYCQNGFPSNYSIPADIQNWPAFDSHGQAIAPFFDANNDGLYNVNDCDYPIIKGDQALFFVFNDAASTHANSGGGKLGLEIHGMAYAYNCMNDPALYNTIFTNYKIINRDSLKTIDSAFVANWTDFDIGAYNDDFIGSDVSRGAYYAYNGDSIDGPSTSLNYGFNPPAQAVVFLGGMSLPTDGQDNSAPGGYSNGYGWNDGVIDNERGGMQYFTYYNNDFNPVNGNPTSANNYYDYMHAYWKNGTHITYGGDGTNGTQASDFMFPGNSDPFGWGTNLIPQSPWDENSSNNVPSDRRGVGAFNYIKFMPSSSLEFDFAYVTGQANNGSYNINVSLMQMYIDSVKQKFEKGITGCGCASSSVGINNIDKNDNIFSFYPNPASTILNINYTGASKTYSIKVYDAIGQLVKFVPSVSTNASTLNIDDLNSGIYLLTIFDGENAVTKRFLKQ